MSFRNVSSALALSWDRVEQLSKLILFRKSFVRTILFIVAFDLRVFPQEMSLGLYFGIGLS